MATVTKRNWTTGKGEARQAWVVAFTDAAGKRHKEQFATKREAEARRVEAEGQVRGGTYRADATSKSVHDACAGYLASLEKRRDRGERVTEHYYRTSQAQLWNYVSPQDDRTIEFDKGIGATKLAQFTTRAVTQFRDDLRDAGVSVVTTRRILGSLSRAIKWARSQDWIATNPVEGVTVTGRRDEGSKKVTPPPKEALSAILKAAGTDLKVKVSFAAASGVRASELWALVWGNVDLDKCEVTIDRRVDAWGNVDVTKSKAGMRTIPLGKAIVAALTGLKRETNMLGDDDLVFPNRKGQHFDHRNVMSREWRPLLAKVKGANPDFEPIGWHALRHFAISTWIEAGLKPKTVQTFAGHSSLAVTMDRYGHLFPADDHREAMDRISAEIFT